MSELNNWRIDGALVLMIWALANTTMTRRVETDLAARAAAAVRAVGHLESDPAVMVLGRDVTLIGVALTEEAERAAVGAADQTVGVRVVNNRIKPVATASPYGFGGRCDGNRQVGADYVALPTTRAGLVEAAKVALPGGIAVDRMPDAQARRTALR